MSSYFSFWLPAAVLAHAAIAANPDTMKTNSRIPLEPVPYVDLARYMGDWRVIANIPYFAEKGCVDSIEGYRARADGKIDNYFTYRKKSFEAPQKRIRALATVKNKQTNSEWRVRFFGFINTKYFITDLDPDYRWAVIAHPSRKYGWVLAREKTLPAATYRSILSRLEKQGYDARQFVKVPQLPSQLPAEKEVRR